MSREAQGTTIGKQHGELVGDPLPTNSSTPRIGYKDVKRA